jgi:hypothetical protein
MQTNPNQVYQDAHQNAKNNLINALTKVAGIPATQVKDLLKARFGETFNINNAGAYLSCVLEFVQARKDKAEKEAAKYEPTFEEQYAKAHPVYIWEDPCPICGAPRVSDHTWDGIYTKKRGWSCQKYGLSHFLQNKAIEICTLNNWPLPVYPEKANA